MSRRGNPPSIVHRVDVIGVSCYTSTDLIHWYFEGALHTQHEQAISVLAASCDNNCYMGANSSECTSDSCENQLLPWCADNDKLTF